MSARETKLFHRTLEERIERYRGAELRSILDTGGSGDPGYVKGTLVFQDQFDEKIEETVEYDAVVLRRQVFDQTAARDLLDELMDQGFADVMRYEGNIPFKQQPRHVMSQKPGWPARLGRRERFSPWPERVFFFSAENGGRLQFLPVAKPHQTPLVSPNPVLDLWLPGEPSDVHMSDSGLYIVCPDYRVALREIEVDGEGLTIRTERHDEFDGDVLLQVAGPDSSDFEQTSQLDADESRISLEELPEELYVFLFDAESEQVLDWAEVDPYSLSQPPMIHTELPPETARDHIAEAESSSVELKGDLRGHDPNVEDFVETLVAFSNTNGGQIYIGVSDDKEIIGVAEEGKTLDRAESWSRDLVEPPLEIETGTVELEGEVLVVVDVPEGENKPYQSLADHNFYVRMGEHDEPMTRSQMDQLYGQENQGLHFVDP